MIESVLTTALTVGDMERSLAFYRDLLGFEVAVELPPKIFNAFPVAVAVSMARPSRLSDEGTKRRRSIARISLEENERISRQGHMPASRGRPLDP